MKADLFTPQDIAEYKRSGFVVARQALPDSHIEAIHSEFAEILKAQLGYLHPSLLQSLRGAGVYQLMCKLFELDQQRYLACLRLMPRLYSMQTLMTHPSVLAGVKALGIELPVMQSRVVFHVMSHELRFKNGYFGFDVHQDWPALQSSLDMVTVWVPLVDVDANLFPLEIIPGSHLKGLCKGGIAEHINTIDKSEYKEAELVPVSVQRGDVVFMSAFNLHRSGTNGRHGDVRLAASCRYENALERHVIEHAYPFCQQTVVNRDLLIKDFPTAAQVREIYSQ